MSQNRYLYTALLAAILIGTAFLRFYDLGHRTMHGDEANQAMKTGVLLEEGTYAYDPFEHHGPTLYYFSLPILWLNGVETVQEITEPMLRVLPALFGLALVLLSWLLVAPISRHAGLWAAGFAAISHGLTYYSRYYVQEISFVFFAAAIVWCGYHYLRTRKVGWALGSGVALGLLHATKETSLLVVIAMVAALACALAWEKLVARRSMSLALNWKHLAGTFAAAVLVSVVLFTSFFTHWRGALDSILTYSTYLGRAEGHGSSALHEQPWYYYLSLLAWTYRSAGPKWSEGLILGMAMLGAVWCFWRPLARNDHSNQSDPKKHDTALLQRFLVFYTLFLVVGFSIIPYKTPWNLLIFLHPLCLLAGLGAQRLVGASRRMPVRAILVALILVGSVQLTQQTWHGIFRYSADVRNPYVYAHTSTAIRRLTQRVADIAAVHPHGDKVHINVFRFDGDYWPLPWYFRAYPNVGYWPNIPESPDADIIITSPEVAPKLQPLLSGEYQIEMNGLRPGVLMPTFIKKELWEAFMAKRSTPTN
ncbi:MAG: TIGR03663 family protein [Candidatus Hydrogenedentes bacterium]|nr:TIGR03663 family protein [Candidatus Hydrogenedentota bacterium]